MYKQLSLTSWHSIELGISGRVLRTYYPDVAASGRRCLHIITFNYHYMPMGATKRAAKITPLFISARVVAPFSLEPHRDVLTKTDDLF